MIELYAVTDPPGAPLPGPAAARVLPGGRLAVVYAPVPDGDADDPAVALWRHEELVEALMEHGDVLPSRYGTRCEDVRAVACAVSKREPEPRSARERSRGTVELSVRVLVGQPFAAAEHHRRERRRLPGGQDARRRARTDGERRSA